MTMKNTFDLLALFGLVVVIGYVASLNDSQATFFLICGLIGGTVMLFSKSR